MKFQDITYACNECEHKTTFTEPVDPDGKAKVEFPRCEYCRAIDMQLVTRGDVRDIDPVAGLYGGLVDELRLTGRLGPSGVQPLDAEELPEVSASKLARRFINQKYGNAKTLKEGRS